MSKTKKIFAGLTALLCMIVMLSGCHVTTSKAYIFSVETGDKIKVSLDTTGDFDLSSDVPFAISMNGEIQTQGTFIYADVYEQYVQVSQNGEKTKLLDSGTKDGNPYVFWCFDGKEYNYAIRVTGSDTGVVLGNMVSEQSARVCFERLTISPAD